MLWVNDPQLAASMVAAWSPVHDALGEAIDDEVHQRAKVVEAGLAAAKLTTGDVTTPLATAVRALRMLNSASNDAKHCHDTEAASNGKPSRRLQPQHSDASTTDGTDHGGTSMEEAVDAVNIKLQAVYTDQDELKMHTASIAAKLDQAVADLASSSYSTQQLLLQQQRLEATIAQQLAAIQSAQHQGDTKLSEHRQEVTSEHSSMQQRQQQLAHNHAASALDQRERGARIAELQLEAVKLRSGLEHVHSELCEQHQGLCFAVEPPRHRGRTQGRAEPPLCRGNGQVRR